MALPKIKTLLAILTFWNVIAFIFVCIATAVTDWSKSSTYEWGIWRWCFRQGTETCNNWSITENSNLKDCEGALTATRAFSVLSIIFVAFCMCLSIAMLAKPTLLNKKLLMVNLCMVAVTNLWLFLGWVMYLGVEARGQCAFKDYSSWLGSSWFLQLFAWIFGLVAIVLSLLIFMKWKQIPRYAGQPPYVPGPVPFAPAPGTYPQPGGYPSYSPQKDAYPAPVPAPYAGYVAPGMYGPTPSTSPYAPLPYW